MIRVLLSPWYLSVYAYVTYGLLVILSIVFLGILTRRKVMKARARQKVELDKYEILLRNNSLRLNSLIYEILKFCKEETRDFRVDVLDVNVSGVAMSVFDSFREKALQSKIDYQAVIPENLFWKSEERCIYLIVSHLLSNALLSTPEKGTILVSAAIVDDKLAIKVKKTGAGIQEEELNPLFDRYRMMGQDDLGLALCKSVATLLKGSISVYSVPGEYAEFDVILPALSDRQRGTSPASLKMASSLDVAKLNAYLLKNLESQITVTDLASFFNVSTRNLYRRFADIGLPPPNEYIKAFRLNYAGRLLRTTSLSIKEIMFDCGFNTKGHFYSEFEKKYGMTPKQYKLQALDSEEQS